MRNITVKVHPSKSNLKKKDQLAWKIAEIASDKAKINKDAIEMVINRIIDNASVAVASINRSSVISSREMALKHSRKNGATLFGINNKFKPTKPKNKPQLNKSINQPTELLTAGSGLNELVDKIKNLKLKKNTIKETGKIRF